VLAAGAYVLNHQSTQPAAPPLAKQTVERQPQTQVAQQASSERPAAQQSGAQQVPGSTAQPSTHPQIARQTTPRATPERPSEQVDSTSSEIAGANAAPYQPTSADDNQFLTEVSQRAPSMRATYTNQLEAVNSEIRETQAYIARYPGDVDARQHLLEVYQQKAMLYSIALDRIQ
jgi:hypothetical protein